MFFICLEINEITVKMCLLGELETNASQHWILNSGSSSCSESNEANLLTGGFLSEDAAANWADWTVLSISLVEAANQDL